MPEHRNPPTVIPARAGIQGDVTGGEPDWMPAFAGMTRGQRRDVRQQPIPARDGEFE